MCKFCDQEQYNPITSIQIDFGMFGEHYLDVTVGEPQKMEDGSKDTMWVDLKKVPIRFCPMCGRDLTKREEE